MVNFLSIFSSHRLTTFSFTVGELMRSLYRKSAHILSGSIYFSWLNDVSVDYDDKELRFFRIGHLLRKSQESTIRNEICNHYFICRCQQNETHLGFHVKSPTF